MFEIDNINSWSYSKYLLFKQCERKYYLHYFAAKDGWKTTAPSESKELYFLKNLISYNHWINNIIIKNIKNCFIINPYSNFNIFYSKFKKQLFKDFSADKYKIINNTWLNNSKSPAIKEILIDNFNVHELFLNAESYLKNILNILTDSKVLEKFYNVPEQAKKNTLSPLMFILNNIKVWNAPHIAWSNNGKLYNLNFYFSEKNNFNNESWNMIAGINTLYWESLLKYSFDKIEMISVFINKSEKSALNIYSRRHPKEVAAIIKNSFREIKSRQTVNNLAFRKNYIKCNDHLKCQNCNFKNYCIKH